MGPREMAAAKVREAAILVTQAWATYAAAVNSGDRKATDIAFADVRSAIAMLDGAVRSMGNPPDGGRAA